MKFFCIWDFDEDEDEYEYGKLEIGGSRSV